MKPTREDPHALVDLVDVLLREGAVVDADVLITVGGVPLVGLKLRAAVAGMATMTDHELLTEWDAARRTRATDDDTAGQTAGDDA